MVLRLSVQNLHKLYILQIKNVLSNVYFLNWLKTSWKHKSVLYLFHWNFSNNMNPWGTGNKANQISFGLPKDSLQRELCKALRVGYELKYI